MGKIYEVGDGREYPSLGSVPQEALCAGDTIEIHWRAEPYREKILIAARGTREQPVTVRGICGPQGQKPVISGHGAAARPGYDTGVTNANKWVVKIGRSGSNKDNNYLSSYVIIENIEVTDCLPEYTFTDWRGETHHYDVFGAGIWVDRGEHITLKNCIVHNCSNGLFVNSRDNEAEGFFVCRDILVEGNEFYDNGIPGSILEHNSYCAAIGITYQFNRYGPLKNGAYGYGLKDRSAGTVIRYNRIEGGRREISLDDGEDNPMIPAHEDYNDAYVYGNLLIENDDGPIRVWGDDEIVHFGGDNPDVPDRGGTLYFFNNTVVSYRQRRVYTENSLDRGAYNNSPASQQWDTKGREERTSLFYFPHGQHVDARNNIFYAAGPEPAPMVPVVDTGSAYFSHNWFSGTYTRFVPNETVDEERGQGREIRLDDSNIIGGDPGFCDASQRDFRLREDSVCRGMGCEAAPECIRRCHKAAFRLGADKAVLTRMPGDRNIGAL